MSSNKTIPSIPVIGVRPVLYDAHVEPNYKHPPSKTEPVGNSNICTVDHYSSLCSRSRDSSRKPSDHDTNLLMFSVSDMLLWQLEGILAKRLVNNNNFSACSFIQSYTNVRFIYICTNNELSNRTTTNEMQLLLTVFVFQVHAGDNPYKARNCNPNIFSRVRPASGSSNFKKCMSGFKCIFDTHADKELNLKKCVAEKSMGEGEECASTSLRANSQKDTECAKRLVCEPESPDSRNLPNRVCKRKRGNGQTCISNDSCLKGYTCSQTKGCHYPWYHDLYWVLDCHAGMHGCLKNLWILNLL